MMKPKEWWIEQTLLSYTIGEPVYRVLENPPTRLDERTSIAHFHVVDKSAYDNAIKAIKWEIKVQFDRPSTVEHLKNLLIELGEQD